MSKTIANTENDLNELLKDNKLLLVSELEGFAGEQQLDLNGDNLPTDLQSSFDNQLDDYFGGKNFLNLKVDNNETNNNWFIKYNNDTYDGSADYSVLVTMLHRIYADIKNLTNTSGTTDSPQNIITEDNYFLKGFSENYFFEDDKNKKSTTNLKDYSDNLSTIAESFIKNISSELYPQRALLSNGQYDLENDQGLISSDGINSTKILKINGVYFKAFKDALSGKKQKYEIKDVADENGTSTHQEKVYIDITETVTEATLETLTDIQAETLQKNKSFSTVITTIDSLLNVYCKNLKDDLQLEETITLLKSLINLLTTVLSQLNIFYSIGVSTTNKVEIYFNSKGFLEINNNIVENLTKLTDFLEYYNNAKKTNEDSFQTFIENQIKKIDNFPTAAQTCISKNVLSLEGFFNKDYLYCLKQVMTANKMIQYEVEDETNIFSYYLSNSVTYKERYIYKGNVYLNKKFTTDVYEKDNKKVELLSLRDITYAMAKEYKEIVSALIDLVEENKSIISGIGVEELEELDLESALKAAEVLHINELVEKIPIIRKITAAVTKGVRNDILIEFNKTNSSSEEDFRVVDLFDSFADVLLKAFNELEKKVVICKSIFLKSEIDKKFQALFNSKDIEDFEQNISGVKDLEDNAKATTLEKNLKDYKSYGLNTQDEIDAKKKNCYFCYKSTNNRSLLKEINFMKDSSEDRDFSDATSSDENGEIYKKYVEKKEQSNLYNTISNTSSLTSIKNYKKLS